MGEEKNVPGGMTSATLIFLPFIISIDGLMGVEAAATPKIISSCLTTKWQQHYYRTYRYIKSRISITLVRYKTGASGGPGCHHIR